MKQFFTFLIISILWSTLSVAKDFKIGQKVENELRFSKKVSFPLEPGVWEIIDRDFWFFGIIKLESITLALIENNEVVALTEFLEGNLSGGYQSDLNMAIVEIFYKDKYDGCYERPEYTLVKKFTKGNSHNCLVIKHIDPIKELYSPDDPDLYVYRKKIRNYVKENNLKLPKNMLVSDHMYFSRLVSNYLYGAIYVDSPQRLGAPENNFNTEETSEYHPLNISKYPKYKEYMDKFIEISSSRHMEFEKIVNAKKRHKLKFASNNSSTVQNDKILYQLKTLNDLYKSGILTDEEFKKTKDKLLNQ
ncbi:SHOCT domain-containing protein [Candidatus Pelagibacter sp.]|nr:SHOCT domain-containing protein [Candidatus Pelagibacter sp.]